MILLSMRLPLHVQCDGGDQPLCCGGCPHRYGRCQEVIIQIEGSQETPYRDEIDLTQPFTKREDLIHQVVSSESDVLEPSVGVDSLWKSFF